MPSPLPQSGFTRTPQSSRMPLTRPCLIPGDTAPLLAAPPPQSSVSSVCSHRAGRTETTERWEQSPVCPVNLLGLRPGLPALPLSSLFKALWGFDDATGKETRQSRKSLETLRPAPHSLLYFL